MFVSEARFLISFLTSLDFLLENGMGNVSKWKESLAERTLSRKAPSLMQLVYGESTNNSTTANSENDNSGDEESDDDFFKPIEEVKKVSRFLPCQDLYQIAYVIIFYQCFFPLMII